MVVNQRLQPGFARNIEVFFKMIKSNFKFSEIKINNVNQKDFIYSIHNIKILIVYLLTKIMEKIHKQVNKIKCEGIINKRFYKNKKNKNTNIIENKKNKNKKNNKLSNDLIINVNIDNNKQIILNNNNENINIIKKNTNNKRKCILKPNITNIIKGTFRLLHMIVNSKLTVDIYSLFANNYIKYNKIDKTINNKRICKTPFKKWYIKGYTNKSDSIKIVNCIFGFSKEILNKNLMTKLRNSNIIKINYIK